MRRINSEHLDDKPATPFRQRGEVSGDIGKQLAAVLAGLDDISDIQKTLKAIWDRLGKLEAMANKAVQYEKDHTEIHRNMVTDDTILAAQQQTVQAMSVQMQVTSDAIGVMQRAIEEFTNKKIEVNVDVPEMKQTPTVAQGNKVYKLKRDQRGLLDEIHERDA